MPASAAKPQPSSQLPPSLSPSSAPQVQALISFLENDAQPAIVLDAQYTILAGNAAYRQQFGTDARPFLGQKCFRVSHGYDAPCDQSGEHCPMAQARALRAPDRVLHVHHTPRGPEHVDVELRPIMDEHGEIVAFVERLNTLRHASPIAGQAQLVGRSPAFNQALSAVQRIAPSRLPVLLLGESGTGKELFAQAVHEASTRAQEPFVIVDCSGLPYDLFESELFGHEKGAFTGAHVRKVGLVETAHGGTLFLDEIGDVPLALQVKLLRLLESGTFRRVGSVETRQADVRLVAATHLPLDAMVRDGRFRKDLFYRLNALPIRLPALCERPGDIPLLVESFLRQQEPGGKARAVTAGAMARLVGHAWPGNVRELRNVIARARLFADGGAIREEHLPEELHAATGPSGPGPVLSKPPPPSVVMRSREVSDDALSELAADRRMSRSALAARLGVSERTLYRRLRRLQLP
ncbi:sigma-54 interaction domain-containing protein [Diaphorobacter aerolatus]|uniref:Sigma-54-dependent Fis family transcriptional regulator n=1 Tax=Diaphorobacter aerolatus TaxID=1288495 RepID=A0A7H0GHY5_9BURK|nr:sigma-54-dependent Fis family transcriptional regulator [Diaphorobacter aerolatus]QNP47901.1 sigma-54-dependent Fis family transcriptional regulator [Diaphorobacter aerolatus]